MFNVINQINYISELNEYQTGIVSDADYRVNEVIKNIKRVHDEIPSLPLISDIHSDNIGLGVNNEGNEIVKIIDYAGW